MRPTDLELHEQLDLARSVALSTVTRSTMRRFLASRPPGSGEPVRVRIWRNCSVEHLFMPLEFLGALGGRAYSLVASGYDDALSFGELDGELSEGDVDVVVLERRRIGLNGDEYAVWLRGRAEWLASVTGHPVVVVEIEADGGHALTIRVGGVLQWAADEAELLNPDAAGHVGSVLSAAGSNLLARELGAVWIPGALGAQKKVVVLDLDGTLHDGVLGEDGLGVKVTEGHLRLQQEVLSARDRGLMVAVVSKNDPDDVAHLLADHPDYALRPEHLVAVEAGWDAKSLAIARIIERTHVGADAVVFVDDNFAELAQVGAAIPQAALVSCEHGPDEAREALRCVEGFRTHRTDAMADLRTADILSDDERRALLEASLGAYIAEARPVVTFLGPDEPLLARLADLAARSNQFNLTLNRSGPERFRAALDASEGLAAVGVAVEDRFSDSGVVAGALVGASGNGIAVVEELFLSCRVLGRGLEDTVVLGALTRALDAVGARELDVAWRLGPRNEPALRWLRSAFPDVDTAGDGTVRIDRAQLVSRATPPEGVTVRDT